MTNETDNAIETATEEAEAPTLEDISQEFSVEEQVSNFQAQPEPTFAPQQPQSFSPDPISDPDAFNQYTQQQNQMLNNVNQTVQSLNEKVQSYEQQLTQQKVDADVEAAVAKVNEKLGVDPKFAEIALEHQYRDDPSFKKIWDNRSQNPKAFDKALGVVADKLAGVFAVKQDHQLTANQLAAKQSMKTMAKTPTADPNEDWANLSSAEFDAKWDDLRRG